MASPLNKIACATSNSNTGTPSCYFEFKDITGLIFVPKGTKFTTAQLTTLYTTLTTGAKAASESSRYYPIQDLVWGESKSQEPTLATLADGTVQLARSGKLHWQFEFVKGGMNRENMLQTLVGNAGAYDALILDKAANAIIGTACDINNAAGGSVNEMQGFALDEIYMPLFSMGESTKHYFNIVFTDIEEMTQRMVYRVLDKTQKVTRITGMRNLELSLYSFASGVLKCHVQTDFGAVDLYDSYAAALVTLTWTATDANGTALTIADAVDATTKTLQFTFSGAEYTALSSGAEINLYGPSISAMEGATPAVVGFGNFIGKFYKP